MARALLLEGPRTLRLRDDDAAGLGPREIRVRALVSGISHGTELNLYRGTSAFADRVFDRDLRAFVRPDPPRPAYPATLGYELVGTVDEIGAEVRELQPGDLVHVGAPHRDEAVLDLDVAAASTYPPVLLPAGGPLERWLFVSLGAVALVAAHDGRIKLGDHVAVIGLGAIGLLLVQLARRAGAGRISAVDPVASRRELALELGRRRGLRSACGRAPSSALPAAPTWRSRRPAPRPGCTMRSRPPGSAGRSSRSASTRAARPRSGSARSGTTTGSTWSRAWAPGARRIGTSPPGTARA